MPGVDVMREANLTNAQPTDVSAVPAHGVVPGWLSDAWSGLAPHTAVFVAIVAFNLVALAADRSYAIWTTADNYEEYGPMTTFKVLETSLTGSLGVLIYRNLASSGSRRALFWLMAGLGLLWLAIDDYVQLHERASWELAEHQAPLVNRWDDLIVLAYGIAGLAALILFRREVFASKPVALLLCLGAAATIVMVALDSFAPVGTEWGGLEDAFHVAASALLLAAFAVKWREVQTSDPFPN
jgi:hypothetical protein